MADKTADDLGPFHIEPFEKLSKRERLSIMYILEFMKSDPFHRPPSQAELMRHLNEVLPKQPDGSPALVSTQQTHRIVVSLRTKGWLENIVGPVRVNRNMYPTGGAQALAKKKQGSQESASR